MLEWIAAVVELCNLALAGGKTLREWAASSLTEREREILASAAESGIIIASSSDQTGRFIFTYTRKFFDLNDPAVAAHYLDAFLALCERGLIIHQSGTTFRLSGKAFDIARSLPKPPDSD